MDHDEDIVPRVIVPKRHSPPRNPYNKKKNKGEVHSNRLDSEFLNPGKTIHFAHSLPPQPMAEQAAQKHSTRRLEHEIARVEEESFSLGSIELNSSERISIMRNERLSDSKERYSNVDLTTVDPPTPVKPRKVKKQVSEKWKQAHSIAPSITLCESVNHNRENRFPIEVLNDDTTIFQWISPSTTPSNNLPLYLNKSNLFFHAR